MSDEEVKCHCGEPDMHPFQKDGQCPIIKYGCKCTSCTPPSEQQPMDWEKASREEWQDYLFMDSGKDTTEDWWINKIKNLLSTQQKDLYAKAEQIKNHYYEMGKMDAEVNFDARVEGFIKEAETLKLDYSDDYTLEDKWGVIKYNQGIEALVALAKQTLQGNKQ